MPELQLKERCQESRRVDYASLSFHVGSASKLQTAFDEVLSCLEQLPAGDSFEESSRPSMHYDRVFVNSLGCRIELTPPGAGLRNAGRMLVSLPGKAFYLQDSAKQAWMLHQLIKSTGYRWFTRIDLENTELNPEVDTDAVFAGVIEGRFWVKGYGTWRPGGDIDAELQSPKGQTVYWGSRRSERQGKTYDKAKDARWNTSAIRDELQLRGEWAKAYGQTLERGLAACHTTDEMADCVSDLVVSGLNNHLQYWQLNGTHPKTDKNWQRKAEVADWFTKRIGTRQEPIRKPQKAENDLDTIVSYGVRQYGRSFGLWMQRYAVANECSLLDAAQTLGMRFLGRLGPSEFPDEGFVEECKKLEAQGAEELWGMEE